MIIFLVGPRGAGKTTIGRAVADRLVLDFIDTDPLVCGAAGCSIAELVEAKGWPAFRQLEKEVLSGTGAKPSVIATGGGIVLDPDNRDFMRRNGLVFYLCVPVDELARRLSLNLDGANRPSLTGKDPIRELADICRDREPLYRQSAHHVIEAARPPDVVAGLILDRVKDGTDQ